VTDLDVIEFTDPVCSYAWGTEPKIRRLRWQYGHRIRWRRVMVGMHAHGWEESTGLSLDDPALPVGATAYWRNVSDLTGMPYPVPLHRSWIGSEDPCRLVKAAELQSADAADRLLRRLRESWFVFGRPADTIERGLDLVPGIPGLDPARLERDAKGPEAEQAYAEDWEEARRPNEYVRTLEDDRVGFGRAQPHNGRLRYGLPCILLSGPAGEATIAGWQDWSGWERALDVVAPGAAATARPLPTPAEAFDTWPLLAAPELELLCGPAAETPPGAVTHDWGAGVVRLTAQEAASRLPTGVPQVS
jgi:protein-disulfide isomerase-like protein with CxxC motif